MQKHHYTQICIHIGAQSHSAIVANAATASHQKYRRNVKAKKIPSAWGRDTTFGFRIWNNNNIPISYCLCNAASRFGRGQTMRASRCTCGFMRKGKCALTMQRQMHSSLSGASQSSLNYFDNYMVVKKVWIDGRTRSASLFSVANFWL